jgi:hypothetical protein
MKNIIIAISFVLISFSVYTQTGASAGFYPGRNDTLLFDGSEDVITIPTNRKDDCKIMVTYAYGSVEGTYYRTDIYKICGNNWDTSVTEVKGALVPNNVLKLGDEITTGNGSYLEIELYDGSIIRMGPNSKLKITGDMCDSRSLIEQTAGEIWNKVKHLLGEQKYNVKTERFGTQIGVRGTEFSVEVTNDEEIIRVYDGSVEVQQQPKNLMSENTSKDFEKLTKDFQEGKITMDEYVRKSQEFQKNVNKQNDQMKIVMCEAGFMVKVSDKISDPEPIKSTGTEWFEDVNFKK